MQIRWQKPTKKADVEFVERAAKAAKDQFDALSLCKNDMDAYLRLYAFLSQTIDYGDTEIEKRFSLFKSLMPLLDFGRERDTGTCRRLCSRTTN